MVLFRFSPCSIISTSTKLTPRTVQVGTLPLKAACFAMATRALRSAEGVVLITDMVGRPPKVLDCHLKAACIASASLGAARRSTSVEASLQEFHGCVLARSVGGSGT